MQINWNFIWTWGGIGIGVFTCMLVLAALFKVQKLVRDEDGRLRKDTPIAGKIVKLIFAILLIGFFVFANVIGFSGDLWLGFGYLFLHNLLVYLTILMFDTLIIDILIIVIWHPDFLNLPDTEGYTSIAFHLKTLLPGTLFGLLLSLIVSLIYSLFII